MKQRYQMMGVVSTEEAKQISDLIREFIHALDRKKIYKRTMEERDTELERPPPSVLRQKYERVEYIRIILYGQMESITTDRRCKERSIERSAAGGGRVVVPAGKYLCGTIELKDGVELRLEQGASLIASLV